MNNPNKLPCVPYEPITVESLALAGTAALRELYDNGDIDADQVTRFLAHLTGVDEFDEDGQSYDEATAFCKNRGTQ